MTDTDKIVAAIFAAGICNKVNTTSADYLQTYYEILGKIAEREKPKPPADYTGVGDAMRRGSRRKRPR